MNNNEPLTDDELIAWSRMNPGVRFKLVTDNVVVSTRRTPDGFNLRYQRFDVQDIRSALSEKEDN